MNDREKKLIEKRRAELSQVIKDQHQLPKKKRDVVAINNAQVRLKRIDEWMNVNTKKQEQPKRISKEEFKKILNLPTPDRTMVIDDVETLEQAWPIALRNNIQLQVNETNAALMKRFKELIRQHKSKALKRR